MAKSKFNNEITRNSSDVQKIFDEEKVLIGDRDVFPMDRAIAIFGKDAVNFCKGLSDWQRYHSLYGIGDYQFHYLTKAGFNVAATYRNICIMRDRTAEMGV